MRPSPGDRGSWSHGPISRVNPRPAASDGATPPAPDPALARRPLPAVPPPRPVAGPTRPTPLPGRDGSGALIHQSMRQPYALPGRAMPQTPGGRPGAPTYPVRPGMPPGRVGFGLPSLRRNVCPHFYMTGTRGAIPIQAPHLLKGLLRQPNNISRCQLRGGVHLDEGYVNDVCLTPRFNQCVFYEDELTRE
jgi:hypothetical protein